MDDIKHTEGSALVPSLTPDASSVRSGGENLRRHYDQEAEPEGDGLFEYWRILTRHKRALIAFAVGGGLLGLAYSLPQTPIYGASAAVEIVTLNQDFLNLRLTSPITTDGSSPSDNISEIQTQIKLIESDSLRQRVLQKLREHRIPVSAPRNWLSPLKDVLGPKPLRPFDEQERLLDRAAKTVKANPSGQTRIINITVDSADPVLAAEFANTLANEFIQQNLESHWKTAETTSVWLAKQLEDMRLRLERSQQALQTYAARTGLLLTGERGSVSEAKLRQLQQDLSAAQEDRIAKQSRNEMAHASPPDELPDVLNDAGLRDIRSKALDLRRQIAELSATYTPEYSKLKRTQAELTTLETAFSRSAAATLSSLQIQCNEAARKEKLLTEAFNAQMVRVADDDEKSIQYNILKREVDSNQQLYETMLGRLRESTIAATMRASNVRVVDPAKIPKQPYKPKIPQTTALGFVAGLFLGAAYLVMRDHADTTIQQPGESGLLLHTTELGVIPSAVVRPKLVPAPLGMTGSKHLVASTKLGAQDPNAAGIKESEPSFLCESFRSTLLSILLSNEHLPRPKVLVVTSPGPREGKSTVASNLAIAAAEFGKRVLLIDADMRKPILQDIFDVPNDRGLSNVLLTMAVLNGDKSLGGLVQATKQPGLFVLTSGPATSTATKLLYTSYARNLLKYLRGEFDLIFVDTPPVLHIPDARVLGRMADNVLMVVWAGHTSRESASAAWGRLREDGSQLLGTILNNWDHTSDPNSSYWADYYRTPSAG